MSAQKAKLIFFFALFIGILALAFFIFFPFVGILIISATFAVLFYPLYQWLRTILRNASLASLITIIFILLIVLVPIVFFGTLAVGEARALYGQISDSGSADIVKRVDFFSTGAGSFLPDINVDVSGYIRQILGWILQNFGSVFSGVFHAIVSFLLGIIALFYFLRDGKKFIGVLEALSPLPDTSDQLIFDHLGKAINSVIRGSLVIAIIQGLLSGAGFFIFGVPNPALWGSLAAIAALIPGIGTALVIVPAVLYLLVVGKLAFAVSLLIWGICAVGLIDNFLGPALVGHGTKIHPFLVLFGVLGGLQLFGPTGFIGGPLVLSLLVALGEVYSKSILTESPARQG